MGNLKKIVNFLVIELESNGKPLSKEKFIDLFNNLKGKKKRELSIVDEKDSENRIFMHIEEVNEQNVFGELICENMGGKPMMKDEAEEYPSEIDDNRIAFITFFSIFYLGTNEAGLDRFIFSYFKNEHSPSYTKLIEIVKKNYNDVVVNFTYLTYTPFEKLKDDPPIYKFKLQVKGDITEISKKFLKLGPEFSNYITGLGVMRMTIGFDSSVGRTKNKHPFKFLKSKEIEAAYRESEGDSNLEDLSLTIGNSLGSLDVIDLVKGKIKADIPLEENYWKNKDKVFQNLSEIFNSKENEIKKSLLFRKA